MLLIDFVAAHALTYPEAGSNFPSLAPGSFLISFSMAIGSALTLSALGTVAGVAPALRALAIKPVDAMRDE